MFRLLLIALVVGCAPAGEADDAAPSAAPPDARADRGVAVDAQAAPDGAGDASDPDFATRLDAADPDARGLADAAMDARSADARPADATPPDGAVPDGAPMVPVGLEVGQRAPGFALPDHDGQQVALADRLGGNVLVFGASSW